MNKVLKLNVREKALLLKSPIMASLSGAALQHMLDNAVVVSYESRHILFREHDPAEFFYCVLSGYIRLYRPNKDGREADIRLCGPSDSFAECLLYAGNAYRYNAQAAEAATLVRFDMQKVRALAERDCEIGKAMLKSISSHLLDTMDCLANDRLQTAPQRLANYLLTTCADDGPSASLRLPFRKSLLAGKLGLAPEALSRAFSTLRQSGVTVQGRIIRINDLSALKQI